MRRRNASRHIGNFDLGGNVDSVRALDSVGGQEDGQNPLIRQLMRSRELCHGGSQVRHGTDYLGGIKPCATARMRFPLATTTPPP